MKDFFGRKYHNIKDFLIKIKDHLRFYSTAEKTSFPNFFCYWPEILEKAKKLSANESKFITTQQCPEKVFFLRKNRNIQNVDIYLENLHNPPYPPENITDLFSNFQIFRNLDILQETCDCSCFFKLGYCKHVIAYQMKNGNFLIIYSLNINL